MTTVTPFRVGDWVTPRTALRKAIHLPKESYRVEEVGIDNQYGNPLDCIKIAGVWVYAADCFGSPPPPPTLAQKEAQANEADGWRKRRDRYLRETFSSDDSLP